MKNLQNNCSQQLPLLSITYYTCILIINLALPTSGLVSYYDNDSDPNRTNTYGWLEPENDVHQSVGESLEIFCSINSDNKEAEFYTSENLYFEKDGEMVDSQNVTTENETTISLYLSNEEESRSLYECYLTINKTQISPSTSPRDRTNNSMGGAIDPTIKNYKYISAMSDNSFEFEVLIGFVWVTVRAGPNEVTNFRCVLYHWATLKCFWDVPENTAETNYTIRYVPINSTLSQETAECPTDQDQFMNMCTWSPLTDPPYLNIYENLEIMIKGINDYGETEQSFIFNKYENIQPDGLSNLNVVKATPTSLNLCWQIGDLKNHPNEWTYEMTFKAQENWLSFICDPEKLIQKDDNICYSISGLEVNTKYTFSIRMRSSISPSHDDYWSPYYTADFQTKPLVPTYVPETDMSLFRIYPTPLGKNRRDVAIYWRPLNFSRPYGDSFNYEVEAYEIGEDGTKKLDSKMRPYSTELWEAKYRLGPSAYQFVIRSANSEGKAKNAASISVPAAKDEVKVSLLYYYVSHLNETFDYIWLPPKYDLGIVNYTLFQVTYLENSQKVIFNSFNMSLIHFPANVTHYRMTKNLTAKTNSTVKRLTRTFIGANTNRFSIGLSPRLFVVFSVSDYFKSEQYIKKVEKSKKYSTRKKIGGKNSATAVHTSWKFSGKQYDKWLNKLIEN